MIRSTVIGLVSVALLAACGKTVTDTACVAFVPIFYSPTTDSPETVTQARQHNAAWVALCERSNK